MLTISDRSTDTCLVIDVEGAIMGDDYDEFTDAFERIVEKHGHADLVINLIGSVKYGDKDAVEEDWEFVREQYGDARRVAFVGDQKMIRAMMRLFAPFTRAKEQLFDAGMLDAAIAWATAKE